MSDKDGLETNIENEAKRKIIWKINQCKKCNNLIILITNAIVFIIQGVIMQNLFSISSPRESPTFEKHKLHSFSWSESQKIS